MNRQISLLYHDVLPPGAAPASSGFGGADADIYKLSQSLFAEHLARIASLDTGDTGDSGGSGGAGRVVVPTKPEFPEAGAKNATPVLFTFDDGGATADEPTTRLLEERGWRGCFFVVTERLDQPGFLSREQLRSMRKRGHLIGSHSRTHPSGFSRLSYAQMLDEWKRSREALEEILGEPVWSASVPGGFYTREVARAASEAGYRVLFNSEPFSGPSQVGELLVLGRYGIQHQTSAQAALALARADRLPRALQAAKWNAKKPLKKIGGPAWLAFRRWFFK
jgi:peptidoglycan/xylan/chitin deacetylase (PgdA/CDA1 family)